MANQGWISIHRKIQECFLWADKEPFDRRSAWIDLLLLANHEEKKMLFDGKPISVNRGERVTSIRILADRWHAWMYRDIPEPYVPDTNIGKMSEIPTDLDKESDKE